METRFHVPSISFVEEEDAELSFVQETKRKGNTKAANKVIDFIVSYLENKNK